MSKKLTLQEKIDRMKPGDTIWHVVEDPNSLVLMRRPTVSREEIRDIFLVNTSHSKNIELLINVLESKGVRVVDD